MIEKNVQQNRKWYSNDTRDYFIVFLIISFTKVADSYFVAFRTTKDIAKQWSKETCWQGIQKKKREFRA